MKKFAMAAVAALSLSTVSAETCASSFSGFYAGAQAGMNSVSGSQKLDSSVAADARKSDLGKKSFMGGLFAGYGMGIGSCAYVGGELYLNFGNNSLNAREDQNLKNTLKNTYNLGAKVRLGYTISQQAMVFLGLGMEKAKWQAKSVLDAANAGRAANTYKKNKSTFAFAPSVGMDMFVNKNLFIRGEFTYVLAPKMKITGATDTPMAGITGGQVYKLNATQQRFTLGLGYKF